MGNAAQVDEVPDRGMGAGLRDDGAAVGVTEEHDRTVRAVQGLGDTGGVAMEIGGRPPIRPVTGEVDGDCLDAVCCEQWDDPIEAPRAVPGAVDENYARAHGRVLSVGIRRDSTLTASFAQHDGGMPMTEDAPAGSSWPFPVPFGWFSAGYADEFAPATAQARHLVGRARGVAGYHR